MKLHRNLALGIHSGLHQILTEEQALRPTLSSLLKNKKWGSRDRKLLAEGLLEIIRWKNRFLYLGNVDPNDADIHWKLIALWILSSEGALPPWEEFNFSDPLTLDNQPNDTLPRIYKESIPDWIDQMGVEAFEASFWEKEIQALNELAPLVIRCNTRHCSLDELQQALLDEYGIESEKISGIPEGLRLPFHQKITHLPLFKKGGFEIQDANSQRVAAWAAPKKNSLIVDACAGGGGKSLHIADLVGDKAKIHAIDIHESKLNQLKQRAQRSSIHSIETHLATETELFEDLKEKADLVLIDAPCSGLGTLRRNPAIKWHLTPEKINKLCALQASLIDKNAQLVKPEGVLIYATCSILPQENTNQVHQFLSSPLGSSFHLEKETNFFAHTSSFDGFYIARMVRNS